jgi:hypothetical protein
LAQYQLGYDQIRRWIAESKLSATSADIEARLRIG